jgi:hypothetical protein
MARGCCSILITAFMGKLMTDCKTRPTCRAQTEGKTPSNEELRPFRRTDPLYASDPKPALIYSQRDSLASARRASQPKLWRPSPCLARRVKQHNVRGSSFAASLVIAASFVINIMMPLIDPEQVDKLQSVARPCQQFPQCGPGSRC